MHAPPLRSNLIRAVDQTCSLPPQLAKVLSVVSLQKHRDLFLVRD